MLSGQLPVTFHGYGAYNTSVCHHRLGEKPVRFKEESATAELYRNSERSFSLSSLTVPGIFARMPDIQAITSRITRLKGGAETLNGL